MLPCQEPLRGILTLMCKKFGILGVLDIRVAVRILGAPYFRKFGSPKIRKDWSAPLKCVTMDSIKKLILTMPVQIMLALT